MFALEAEIGSRWACGPRAQKGRCAKGPLAQKGRVRRRAVCAKRALRPGFSSLSGLWHLRCRFPPPPQLTPCQIPTYLQERMRAS